MVGWREQYSLGILYNVYVVIKAMGFGVEQTVSAFTSFALISQLCDTGQITFLIYTIEMVILPHRVLVRIALTNVCNVLTSINKGYYYYYYPRIRLKKVTSPGQWCSVG